MTKLDTKALKAVSGGTFKWGGGHGKHDPKGGKSGHSSGKKC